MSETLLDEAVAERRTAFSILERIVMGETEIEYTHEVPLPVFQYPRTDRDG